MIKFETMGEDTVCCTVTGSLHDLQQEVIGMYTQLKKRSCSQPIVLTRNRA
jgi:hypothetical protein